jgi:hypothetical protein
MKVRTEKVVDVSEWDKLVKETYGRPYCFQQQDGCRDRGIFYLSVPDDDDHDALSHDVIPEIVNHKTKCVKFAVWLARDPKQPLAGGVDEGGVDKGVRTEMWAIEMWWDRNFYPNIHVIANDLHKKGLLESGEYLINIDW